MFSLPPNPLLRVRREASRIVCCTWLPSFRIKQERGRALHALPTITNRLWSRVTRMSASPGAPSE